MRAHAGRGESEGDGEEEVGCSAHEFVKPETTAACKGELWGRGWWACFRGAVQFNPPLKVYSQAQGAPSAGRAHRHSKVAPRVATRLVGLMDSCAPPASTALDHGASPAARPSATALPDGVRAGSEHLVLLTPAAGQKAAALMTREKQGDYLRVAISGGGCNGLSYKMKFVAEPRRGDIVVRTAGVPVLVDSKSALYLKGTHVDYSSALVAGGFKFTNPNAKASCSCGESFSV